MGRWGTDSDESDEVMDAVDYFLNNEDLQADKEKLEKKLKYADVGVIVHLVKLGWILPLGIILDTHTYLKDELLDLQNGIGGYELWRKPEQRIESIKKELKLLEETCKIAEQIKLKLINDLELLGYPPYAAKLIADNKYGITTCHNFGNKKQSRKNKKRSRKNKKRSLKK